MNTPKNFIAGDLDTTMLEPEEIEAIQTGGVWLRRTGALLVAAGALTIILAGFTTFFTIAALGIALLVGGVVHAGACFGVKKWSGFFVGLVVSILYVIAGVLVLSNPVPTAVALTLLMVMYFMVTGVFKILASAIIQFPKWGYVLIGGLVNIAFGALVLARIQTASFWLLGLLIGVEMLITASWLMSVGVASKKLSTPVIKMAA